MGVPIFNFNDFERKFNILKEKRSIFGLLLYDSRLSHQAVADFAFTRRDWFDELAHGGDIYFFFPVRELSPNEFDNPSMRIASLFGILPNQLPGIIFFSYIPPANEACNNVGIYLPISQDYFQNRQGDLEVFLSDIFSTIRECQLDSQDRISSEMMDDLSRELNRVMQREKRFLVSKILGRKAAHIFSIPEKVTQSFFEGLGKAIGDRLMGP